MIVCMTWLLRIMAVFTSTHIHGTNVPVEEPSTASKADIWLRRNNGRYGLWAVNDILHRENSEPFRRSQLVALNARAPSHFTSFASCSEVGC